METRSEKIILHYDMFDSRSKVLALLQLEQVMEIVRQVPVRFIVVLQYMRTTLPLCTVDTCQKMNLLMALDIVTIGKI